jgi:hypothetical protein
MRRGVALLLLTLAACGRVSAPPDSNDMPAPSNMTGTSAAPTPAAPMPMPMDQNMSAEAPPDEAHTGGPRERFIVCPGNPRCPPSGNPPRNKPD